MNTSAQPFANIGDHIEDTIDNVLIRVTRIEDQAYNLYVQNGPNYVSELSRSFSGPNAAVAACRRASTLRGALMENKVSIHQLIGDQQARQERTLTEAELIVNHAAQTMTARDPETVAAQINAEWDARHAQTVKTHNEIVTDVQAIVGDGQGFNAYRQTITAQTRAAKTSEPMDAILHTAAQHGGRIQRGGGHGQANSRQLIALNRRGLVDLTYGRRGNQRVITGGQLTVKGYKLASTQAAAA